MIFALVLFFLGLLLVSFGTWLSPFLAFVLYKTTQANIFVQNYKTSDSLDVLIPAHSERESLPATIASIQSLHSENVFSKVKVIVALSNWTGPEATKASEKADKVFVVNEPGKWKALQRLVQNSTADWIALVDAGTTWRKDLLTDLQPYFLEKNIVAINPRYLEIKSGLIQKIIWSFESFLKQFENQSGGPISLHGSTIFYHREELQAAMKFLGETTEWLNDDVVVPLTVRSLFPQQKIVYTRDLAVVDLFPSSNLSEMKRRKRVLFGNIQWVKSFLAQLLKFHPVLAILALRRITRMIWAWWIILILAGLNLFLIQAEHISALSLLMVLTLGLALVAIRPSGRRLLEAFWVSLLMPVYFVSFETDTATLKWK